MNDNRISAFLQYINAGICAFLHNYFKTLVHFLHRYLCLHFFHTCRRSRIIIPAPPFFYSLYFFSIHTPSVCVDASTTNTILSFFEKDGIITINTIKVSLLTTHNGCIHSCCIGRLVLLVNLLVCNQRISHQSTPFEILFTHINL